VKTEIVKLSEKRSIAVVTTGDVEPILERNKLLRTITQTNTDGLKHAATVPNEVAVGWLNEEWKRGNMLRYMSKEWKELVARKLQDPAWRDLRVDGPVWRTGYK
jgi:hypothetical protein